MTRRALKLDEALFVGRLTIINGNWRRPSSLGVAVWCPYCKTEHHHGWPSPPFRSDHVEHRIAHCTDQRDRDGQFKTPPATEWGYWIGLDPSHAEHNRKILEKLQQINRFFVTHAPEAP